MEGDAVSLWGHGLPSTESLLLTSKLIYRLNTHRNIEEACQRNLPVTPSSGADVHHEIWRAHDSHVVVPQHLARISRSQRRGRDVSEVCVGGRSSASLEGRVPLSEDGPMGGQPWSRRSTTPQCEGVRETRH